MPLLADLEGTFSAGGFDLDATVGSLGAALTAVRPASAELDADALARAVGRAGDADFGAIGVAAEGVVSLAGRLGADLPSPDELLRPLTRALETAAALVDGRAADALASLEGAAASASGAPGLAGLAAPLRALEAAGGSAPVEAVAGIAAGLVPGLDLRRPGALIGGHAGGVVSLVQLLGALMATEGLSRELESGAVRVAGMLDAGQAAGLLGELDRLARSSGLPDLVRAVDPDDPDLVAAVAMPVEELADAVRTAADELVRGLAFGEAALVQGGFAGKAAGLEAASALLAESALPPVRQLALDLRAAVEPLLAVDLGAPAESFDAFLEEALGLAGDLGAAIDGFDPATLAAPLTRGLRDALDAVEGVTRTVEEAAAAFRSAFGTVGQAVAAVDLRPVAEAIQAAFRPAAEALTTVEEAVGDAQEAIELASTTVVGALNTVKSTLGAAANVILGAYEGVAGAIEALGLDGLQAQLEGGIREVVQALEAAQLQPYFDTAIDVMSTTADVVDAVPLDLLPDDARRELEGAARPIKQIDFDTAVRVVLVGQLRAILDSLDTDVLAEVEEAYAQVLAFLRQIDPRPALEELERELFDPMLERVLAVDPGAVLAPVASVLDELREAVARLDLDADVLGPAEEAFDELARAFASLDPAPLVTPLEQRVTELREQVAEALRLERLRGWIETGDLLVGSALERVDFDRLVELLDGAFARIRPEAGGRGGPSVLGTVVSGLAEGTGLAIRPDSFETVAGWLAGDDAAAEVRRRLGAAVASLESARGAAERADTASAAARLQPLHRALMAAVESHPADSLLRRRLAPVLARSAPLELLGATVANRARYLQALDDALRLARRAAGSGRSEVGAVAGGLRDALRPLTAIPDKLRSALARFGLDPGGDLRSLLGRLLDRLTPSRLLAPLSAAVAALVGKLAAVVHEGLVAPLLGAIADVERVLAALDISFLRAELVGIHAEIAAQIEALRPSALLGPLLASVDETRQAILDFDPLGAARTAIEALQAAIAEVARDFRPTTLYGPVLVLYDHILAVASGLDVRNLLEPILTALAEVERQLEEGLDRSATALQRLQAALP